MVSKVIGKKLGGSFPGTITRGGHQLVQARTTAEITKFGLPAVLDAANNQWRPFDTADAESDIVGFFTRQVRQANDFANQDKNENPAGYDVDILSQGFVAVEVTAGTPAVGGQVYVVKTVGDSGLAIGDVVATNSIGTGTVVTLPLSFARFTTLKDDVTDTAEVHVLVNRI